VCLPLMAHSLILGCQIALSWESCEMVISMSKLPEFPSAASTTLLSPALGSLHALALLACPGAHCNLSSKRGGARKVMGVEGRAVSTGV